jgi:mono/diheme cytochrome c family protein
VKRIVKIAAGCSLAISMPSAVAQETGEAVYKLRCSMCHAVDGTASTPAGKALKAASFKDPAVVKLSEADMLAVVKGGKANKMPAFGTILTPEQIQAAVGYIRSSLEK